PVQRGRPQRPDAEALRDTYPAEMPEPTHHAGIPGASVAIIRDTTIIFQQGFGVKSVGGIDSVDDRTVFRIGSVSKCFAAMLTATLVEENVLNWEIGRASCREKG